MASARGTLGELYGINRSVQRQTVTESERWKVVTRMDEPAAKEPSPRKPNAHQAPEACAKRPPQSLQEWKVWGTYDPLWGVAAWPGKRKSDSQAWSDAEFERLGATDWQDFWTRWERYGVGPYRCLEIGCGAGRLTSQIAKVFEEVIALDVSEGMIAEARQRVNNSAVRFALSDGTRIPAEDSSVSGVFSAHVFQHFDSLEYAAYYFREVARILQPGGSMMIHLPVFRSHPHTPLLARKALQLRLRIGAAAVQLRRHLLARAWGAPFMDMIYFPEEWLFETVAAAGLSEVELIQFAVRSNGAIHPFVMARKGTANSESIEAFP